MVVPLKTDLFMTYVLNINDKQVFQNDNEYQWHHFNTIFCLQS